MANVSYLIFDKDFLKMGANWSKLLKQVPYSCYELGHTWNPSCSASGVEVGLSSFEEALKIYSSVYIVSMKDKEKAMTSRKQICDFFKLVPMVLELFQLGQKVDK